MLGCLRPRLRYRRATASGRSRKADALLALILLSLCDHAWASEFIVDNTTDCAVWNPNPVAGESISWDGGCTNGKAVGTGTVHWFEAGEEVQTASGTFEAGRIIGRGTVSWASGHRYEGEFKDSEFYGVGVFTWPDGSRYEGEFSVGRRHGTGVHSSPSGHRYEGPYFRGERHGEGRCFSPGFGWEACRWFQGERIEGGVEA